MDRDFFVILFCLFIRNQNDNIYIFCMNHDVFNIVQSVEFDDQGGAGTVLINIAR